MRDIDTLRLAGEALYGSRWQTELARTLGWNDARRIRQWLSESRPIPNGVWEGITELLEERLKKIEAALAELESAE